MSTEFTAVGRYYLVYVDGSEVSQHTTEREACQKCTEVLDEQPDADVRYRHEYEVVALRRSFGTGGSVIPIAPPVANPNTVIPALYALELVAPREAGTFPSADAGTPAFPTLHRCHRAYPGIPYEFQPDIIHGSYPYSLALSNAPSGMEIQSRTSPTGQTYYVVYWPNPTGTTETPTLTVTDAEGTQVSAAWTITITTSGFYFVDPVSGSDAAAGTLAAPWATLEHAIATATATDFLYIRGGTLTTSGMYTPSHSNGSVDTTAYTPTTTSWEVDLTDDLTGVGLIFETGANAGIGVLVTSWSLVGGRGRIESLHANVLNEAPSNGDTFGTGNSWQRTEVSPAGNDPVVWLAYPGETVLIDNNFTSYLSDWGGFVRISGSTAVAAHIDGIRPTGALDKGFQYAGGSYGCFRNINGRSGDYATNIEGSNPAGIMHMGSVGAPSYIAYQNIDFRNTAVGAIKQYYNEKGSWTGILADTCDYPPDLKADCYLMDVRDFKFVGNIGSAGIQTGIFGNMAAGDAETSGEIRYFYVEAVGDEACDIGQNGSIGPLNMYRGTLRGQVRVRNITSADGPVDITYCVIETTDSGTPAGSGVVHQSVSDATRVTSNFGESFDPTDNLVVAPTDSAIGSDGTLQGAYAQYVGTFGWQIP